MLSSVIITQILGGIQAAINEAPQIEALVSSAKACFDALFTGGLISAATQNACHAFVDGLAAMKAAGIVPPAWQIEADPVAAVVTPAPSK